MKTNKTMKMMRTTGNRYAHGTAWKGTMRKEEGKSAFYFDRTAQSSFVWSMGRSGVFFIQCTTKKLSEKIGDEVHGHPSTSHASMQNYWTATSHLAFENERARESEREKWECDFSAWNGYTWAGVFFVLNRDNTNCDSDKNNNKAGECNAWRECVLLLYISLPHILSFSAFESQILFSVPNSSMEWAEVHIYSVTQSISQ